MSDVRLEIKIRKKDKLLRGIESLASNPYELPDVEEQPYKWHIFCTEAITEAALFFYSGLPEKDALKMVDLFLEKSSETELAVGLNALRTGTLRRRSTDYHKFLFKEIARYVDISGYGEIIRHEPEHPMQEVFDLAKDAKESAPAKTSYQAANSGKP